jgi:hypothetical protein
MTAIRTVCPIDGTIEVTDLDVVLTVAEVPSTASYEFVCPACRDTVVKPADQHTVRLLLSAGVRTRAGQLPRDPAEQSRLQPPLTSDDLLDLMLALQDDHAVGRSL